MLRNASPRHWLAHLSLACVVLAGIPTAIGALVANARQEREGVLIEHIAHAAFRITSTSGSSVLVDPYASRTWIGYDFPAGPVDDDAVLITHPHYDHDAGIYRGMDPPWDDAMPVHREPGYYEVGDIRVLGVQGKHADPYGTEFGQINTIWRIEVDGVAIVHVGDNGPIDDAIATQLGEVDLLLLPIDDQFHILSQFEIEDVLRRLDPSLLIPMHYRENALEPAADEPEALGAIEDWLRLHGSPTPVRRANGHAVRLTANDLPGEREILVFGVSPDVPPPAPSLIVRNVTVIDPATGERPGMSVAIAGDTIVQVADDEIPSDTATVVMDGTGKYLLPGLWDAHVHFAYDPEIAPAMFNLFLANGITSVHDTGGQLETVLPWRDHARSGELPAPRVFVAGPLIDGDPRVYDGRAGRPDLGTPIGSPADARQKVDELVAASVDLIKAYELLSPATFDAVVTRAAELGRPVTGHAPLSMDASDASVGMSSMEHLRNLELACSSEASAMLAERRDLMAAGWESGGSLRGSIHAARRPRAVDTQDEARCNRLVATLKANGTWQVPTLTIVMPRVTRLHARPEWRANFSYLPEPVRVRWLQRAEALTSSTPDAAAIAHADWARAMVLRLSRANVPIMAGTDTPISLLTPGFSLHEELALLVEAGLTPLQAIEAATLTPARFFGLENIMGTIAAGKQADLILLTANPLDNIRATASIDAVVRAGHLFDRATLDELLRAAPESDGRAY